MSFIDSYKKLEKICNEIYGDNHGISTYIETMTNIPSASRYVSRWDEDLKLLKHYRWIRNKIVHEPGCTEDNMCDYADIQWLNEFYSRIMTGNDPLTLYRKVTKPQKATVRKQQFYTQQYTIPTPNSNKSAKSSNKLAWLLGISLAVVIVICIVALVWLWYLTYFTQQNTKNTPKACGFWGVSNYAIVGLSYVSNSCCYCFALSFFISFIDIRYFYFNLC